MPKKSEYKVVILGSGPAGLTAAVYASRADLEPLVIEGGGGGDPTDLPGGQLMLTTEVDNYPGFPQGILGPELMEKMRAQAERFGSEFAAGAVRAVDLDQRPFVLTLDGSHVVRAQTLIVATGARARWLELPEELEFRTKGWGVSACATCDAFFYKGKDVVVVGGGDTAMEEALFLTRFGTEVHVIHRRDELRASKVMAARARANEKIRFRWNTVVTEALGDAKLTGLRLRDVKTGAETVEEFGGLFMGIGHAPNTAFLGGQLPTDERGYLLTKPGRTATEIPGVYACGDCADPYYRQAVTAAGTGCMAAVEAERWLEERAHAG
jgi:thioredoxin reductase (NADPH)